MIKYLRYSDVKWVNKCFRTETLKQVSMCIRVCVFDTSLTWIQLVGRSSKQSLTVNKL